MKPQLPMTLLALALCAACGSAHAADAGVHNDFDGDGRSDLIWRNAEHRADVIWRNGDPPATLRSSSASATPIGRSPAAGDFDGDQRADILWRNRATGAMVIWYAGSRDAHRSRCDSDSADVLSTVPTGSRQRIGDFDGDRAIRRLLAQPGHRRQRHWLQRGD